MVINTDIYCLSLVFACCKVMLKVPPVMVVFENKQNEQFAGKEMKAAWLSTLLEFTTVFAWTEVVEGAASRLEIDFC